MPKLWTVLTICFSVVLVATPAPASEVLRWNETTMQAIEANGQNPIVSTRTLAMTHAAIHDALNAIDRRYAAYYYEGTPTPAASLSDTAQPMSSWQRPYVTQAQPDGIAGICCKA